MYSILVRNVLLPVYWRFRSSDQKCINQFQREFERNQWLSPEAIKRLQWVKTKRIIYYAYNHVEFYREKFKEFNVTPSDIKSQKDMLKLPVITKQELRVNFPAKVIAKHTPSEEIIIDRTSGTTGFPFKIAKNKRILLLGEALWRRNDRWCGLEKGEKYAFLWYFKRSNKKPNFSEKLFRKIFNSPLRLSIIDMDEFKLIEYFNKLSNYKPKALISYWSGLRLLAKIVRKHDLELNIDICIGCSDDAIGRELIESEFNSITFNRYASNEFHNIANECQRRNGLHINAEHVFLEFTRDNEHVSDGEMGKIIITDLDNRVMPFIRYEIGDVGVPSDEVCACGMGLPLMKNMQGRIANLIVTPKGKLSTGPFFRILLMELGDYIEQFQVVQKKKNTIIIYLVKGKNYQEKIGEYILRKCTEYADDIDFSLEFVESIPPEQSGKYNIVKSEISHSI